ncbi:FecR family protein [Pseudomonas aeruginosa]
MFCALLVATLFWRDQSLGPNLAYGTAPGEQREVVLADGSKLFLDVDTQVQVRYAERTRDVLLKKGQVFFVVSHDPTRPFRVGSGDSRVTVLGTQFSVRRDAQAFAVAVKQGRVALQPSLEKDAEHVLLAGDSARLDLADQRLELGHVAPEQVASWRDGQLVFRDKPLGELVEELSRYRAAPIRLGDLRLAGKRVSGTVRIARPDDFLLALPALLPVRVQPQAGGEVLILAR